MPMHIHRHLHVCIAVFDYTTCIFGYTFLYAHTCCSHNYLYSFYSSLPLPYLTLPPSLLPSLPHSIPPSLPPSLTPSLHPSLPPSLSSQNEVGCEDVEGGLKKVTFSHTPIISVYLLAFIVGEYDCGGHGYR